MVAAQTSLKSRMLKAGGWNLVGIVALTLIRLGSNLILTRYLAPQAFGLVMFASTVVTAFEMFSDLGIRQSIVREKDAHTDHFLRVAWTVKVMRGAVIASGILAVAMAFYLFAEALAPARTIYADPRMPGILALVAFSPLLMSCSATTFEHAERVFNFRSVVTITVSSKIISAAATIGLAEMTPSIWALIVGMLIGSAAHCLGTHFYLNTPRMRWTRDREIEGRLWTFGRFIMGSSAFTMLATNTDRLLLASLLPATVFGFYAIAMIWVVAAQQAVGKLIGSVAFSGVAEVMRDRPQDIQRFLRRVQFILDGICAATAVAAVFIGPIILDLLYPDRYQMVGQFLRLLAPALMVQRFAPLATVMLNLGHSRAMMMNSFLTFVGVLIGLPIGFALGGVKGAVIAAATAPLLASLWAMWRTRATFGPKATAISLFWVVGILVCDVVLAVMITLPEMSQ